jgi:hypothetical protein
MKIESIKITKKDLEKLEAESHVHDVYCTVQIEGRKNPSRYRISNPFKKDQFHVWLLGLYVTKDQLIII